MRLYVVSSIYQFINALSIEIKRNRQDADILLIKPFFKEYFDLKKLEKFKIFHKIYYWQGKFEKLFITAQNTKDYLFNSVKKIFVLLEKKKLKKTLPNINGKYDEIVVFYPDSPSRLVVTFLSKKNTKIIFGEDGTYTYECFCRTESILKRIAFLIFFRGDLKEKCKEVNVYRPEFVNLGKKNIRIEKIFPQLEKIKKIFEEISIYGMDNIQKLDKNIIMFDQNLEYDDVIAKQILIAEEINYKFKPEKFVVKLHPGTKVNHYSQSIRQYKSKIPFELLMPSINIENKILISIFSTTCMNPKLLLDVEPVVIFTYKITEIEKLDFFDEKYLGLINKLKLLYRDKSKVLIPESINELKKAVEKYTF